MVVVHPATRNTIKLPRRTTGAAVTVAVFTKARLRLTRANPKFHKGHRRAAASMVIEVCMQHSRPRRSLPYHRAVTVTGIGG